MLLAISICVTIGDDQEKRQEIAGLTSKLNDITNQFTGGDTYAYFTAVSNMGVGDPPTYPLTLMVKGKYPIRNTVVEIQTVSDDPAKPNLIRQIPVGDGTLFPDRYLLENFRVSLGRHIITIRSGIRRINQTLELSMASDGLQQTGDVFENGKKLHDIGESHKR